MDTTIVAALQVAREKKITKQAWWLWSVLVVDHSAGQGFRLSVADASAIVDCTPASARRYLWELVDTGLLVAETPGSAGRGKSTVYRLADLTSAQETERREPTAQTGHVTQSQYGTMQVGPTYPYRLHGVVAEVPLPEPPPEPLEPDRPKRRATKNTVSVEKQYYGQHRIILLSDRDVEMLNARAPGWQACIEPADWWLYTKNTTKKDYAQFLFNWVRREKNNVAVPAQETQEQVAMHSAASEAAAAHMNEIRIKNNWLGGLENE